MEIMQTLKIIDTIVSIAKPIVEVLSPKLPKSMKDFVEGMLSISEKYPSIEEFDKMIDKAASIMGDILEVLEINAGVADILGIKITQSDKRRDDFDTTDLYIKYLNNEVELDNVKLEMLSIGERVVYSIIGIAVEVSVIGEKLKVEIPADIVGLIAKIAEVGKVVFEAKEMVTLITKLKEEGIFNLNDIYDCLKGTGDSDRLKTGEALMKAIEDIKPNKGKDIINELINEVRE